MYYHNENSEVSHLIFFSILLFLFLFLSQNSFAVCIDSGIEEFTCNTASPNPDTNGVQQSANALDLDVIVVPNGEIDTSSTPGSNAISTGVGDDNITANGGIITGESRGINTADGDDTITASNSSITGESNGGISSGDGDDDIEVDNTDVFGGQRGINTGDGDDNVIITDSEVTGAQQAIRTGSDDDEITLDGDSVINGDIEGGAGNDAFNILSDIEINGVIDGDGGTESGFDTLSFQMEVSDEDFDDTQDAIESLPTGEGVNGSVVINGITYNYTNINQILSEIISQSNPSVPDNNDDENTGGDGDSGGGSKCSLVDSGNYNKIDMFSSLMALILLPLTVLIRRKIGFIAKED